MRGERDMVQRKGEKEGREGGERDMVQIYLRGGGGGGGRDRDMV